MSICDNQMSTCCKSNEFIKSDTYEMCIQYAFYDKNGRKYSHQRRIPKNKLDIYKNKILLLENEVKKCNDFESLYDLFFNNKTAGIGILTVYDISLRVGQNHGIYPDKVYLHAGTREGALYSGLIKKYDKRNKLTMSEVSAKHSWLKDVQPYLIEDFLCIYKKCVSRKNLQKYLEFNGIKSEKCKSTMKGIFI